VVSLDFPNLELIIDGDCVPSRMALALNKHVLLRMLQQGYRSFRANSDGMTPVVAEGGCGRFVAMPLRMLPKKIASQPIPQEVKVRMENKVVEPVPVPVVSPLEELNGTVEELRNKLKLLFDESAVLLRKVKEVALTQKQKEREFVQTRRALERIRMAI